MLKISLAISAVLAVLGTSESFIPPAGRCKNVNSLPVDYYALFTIRHWHSVYIPDGTAFSKIVADYEDIFEDSDITAIKGLHRFKMEDNSLESYVYTYRTSLGSDNYILYEDVTGEQGQNKEFRIYTLGEVNEEKAILYYRCTHNGSLDNDTRFITVPRGTKISPAAEQRLLALDRTFNFTGAIRKLDNPTL